jgi:hypothetical protein
VAHFLPGDGLDLASHLSLTYSVGMVQILDDGGMLALEVPVEQTNDIVVHRPLLIIFILAPATG